MNYLSIKETAQAYVDRYDDELVNVMPSLTRIVEGKINNSLRTGEQSVRAQIWLRSNEEYYGLPSDFGGFRDVEILSEGQQHGRTLVYLAPEEMNKLSRENNSDRGRHHYYTVIAGQIQIAPPTEHQVLEVVYYQRLPALVDDEDSNWLTESNPDAYVFGLCTEMAAFAKDEPSFQTYDARFKEVLGQITQNDQVTRWSGPALRVQVEGLVV
jgi:hypothetical protein